MLDSFYLTGKNSSYIMCNVTYIKSETFIAHFYAFLTFVPKSTSLLTIKI